MTSQSARQTLFPIALAAAACCTGLSATAASLHIVASSSVASGLPDSLDYATNTASDLASVHTLSTSVLSYGSSASGYAQGGAGVIRMDAWVHAVNPATFGYPTGGHLIQSAGQNNGVGITDQLRVNSATLAAGTPVDLLFTLSFAQTVSLSQAASMFLGGGYYATFQANAQSGASLQLVANGIDNLAATGSSAVLHTFVGNYINLSEAMSGGAGATYFDSTERSAHADASHSAHFFVDPLSVGVSLSTDSGHNYATAAAVPEPSSAALGLAGGVVVGWLARRRRHLALRA